MKEGGRCVVDDDGGFAGSAGRAGAGSGGGGTGGRSSGLECGDGTHEADGECVPDEEGGGAAPRAPVGAACTGGQDCATGECGMTDMLPGGYCTVLGCSADNPCPVGSLCYASSTGIRLCMAFCEGDVDCREGGDYHCQSLYNGLGICAPSCTITGQCSSGTRCNEDNGLCELTNCDPADPGDACADDETCWPDTRGLSEDGGLCLRLCDPANAGATCVAMKEVCQPLAADPANTGFCAPPVCSATHECPAGATCEHDVCQPPALCDDDNPCGDGLVCVGGKCLSECPSDDTTCADIHPGLVCADVLDEPACLPLGSFPGSACRANRDDACSPVTAGDASAPMVCQDDLCLVDCTTGGNELCESVSTSLACATGIFDTPLCLPKGAFPGGPCGEGDTCAQDLEGNPEVDMVCLAGTCVIDCDESAKWDGWGDAMCQIVSPALTCSESAGSVCVRACVEGACDDGYSCLDAGALPDHQNACLPDGSFPGSECRDTVGDECDDDLGGNAAVDQRCVNDTCVVECAADTEAICDGVSASLTCAAAAGNICVLQCVAGQCLPGYSCLTTESACLPDGTFPGSECRDEVGNECDDNLGGNAAVDQRCVNDTCVVECPADTEAICDGVSASLTCSESAGNICVVACVAGNCLPGFSCLDPGGENACLPTGSFPGSPCRATVGNECDANLGGNAAVDMTCVAGTCVVDCTTGGDSLCTAVDASLTCSETAGDICVLACSAGSCPNGYSCFDQGGENACLPDGTFPGSACRATGQACDQDLNGNAAVDMTCVDDVCVIDCQAGGDALCGAVDASLTCSESASDICVLECAVGACPSGYSCLDPAGENACLPNGTFPGSACRPTSGDECDQNLGGNAAVDMACVAGTCVIDCTTGGDGLCTAVDQSLTCSETAGDICVIECGAAGACPSGYSCLDPGGENACLPNGTFPGSTCRSSGTACDADLGGVPSIDMECVNNTCVVSCGTNNDALCAAVDSSLTCSESASDICVLSCASDPCPTGYSCLTFNNEDACLPTGSFPSSPCRSTVGDECDQNLLGNAAIDMECTAADVCAVKCDGNNDALCSAFNSAWTCSTVAGDVCLIACVAGACPTGYSCFAPENVCFPN